MTTGDVHGPPAPDYQVTINTGKDLAHTTVAYGSQSGIEYNSGQERLPDGIAELTFSTEIDNIC